MSEADLVLALHLSGEFCPGDGEGCVIRKAYDRGRVDEQAECVRLVQALHDGPLPEGIGSLGSPWYKGLRDAITAICFVDREETPR